MRFQVLGLLHELQRDEYFDDLASPVFFVKNFCFKGSERWLGDLEKREVTVVDCGDYALLEQLDELLYQSVVEGFLLPSCETAIG